MYRKRIAVIGRGTVGCAAVAYFRQKTDWEIDWIYDPNIRPAAVGEGTNLKFPQMLTQTIDFDGIHMDNMIATPKMGIWKRDWGQGGDYIHTFPADTHGIHFSAVEFQDYVFELLKDDVRIRTIEQNTTDYENVDADYVMVCTGTPKDLNDEYHIRKHIPVNKATVFQCPWDYPRFNYSLTFAHKHGWVFGIPLKTRCSIGYVYNGEMATEEEVTEDVQDLLQEFELTPASSRSLNFSNYTRKQNFNGRVVYNGNCSYFLEPLEATSTGFATNIIEASHQMWTGQITQDFAETLYQFFSNDIESMIALHYLRNDTFDTDFWKHASSLAIDKMKKEIMIDGEFPKMLRKALDYDRNNMVYPGNSHDVGTWPLRSYVQNIDGLGFQDDLRELLK